MTVPDQTSAQTRSLPQDLCARGLELVETHVSWVFRGEGEVFKVKKPVSLGFLDFSTPARRRAACEAEVELNRRLARPVYLGVVPITRAVDGRHRFGGDGPPVDWAVHMLRLPDSCRADRLLHAGELGTTEVERIADRLVAFHRQARCDHETASYGSAEAISRNVRENFEQTRDSVDVHLSRAEAEEIETWQTRFVRRNGERFDARIRGHRVRDGHGDLRLEHIYLDAAGNTDDRITIIDCIEFNRRFRYADVCADVAFLAMDLTWHGHAGLAERFLAAYARRSNDYDLYPLVDFYESYRAYVRAKVATMLAADADAAATTREQAARQARRYYLLALASERRSLLPPQLIAVGGVIASGKSTLAGRIAAELAVPVVDSDRTRKFLVGVEPQQRVEHPSWQGAYAPGVTRKVYSEVLRRAGAVLESGRTVVVDASFRSRAARNAVRELARTHGAAFLFVECRARPEVCRERLRQRAREGGVSDGRLEIFDDFVARWEPLGGDEMPAAERYVLDTSRPLDESLRHLRRRLPTWPAEQTRARCFT